MMKKLKCGTRPLWLLCSVIPALVCVLVRRWQLATAFEGDLALHVKGAPASVVLSCVLVMGMALLLMLAIRQQEYRPPRGSGQKKRPASMLAKGDTITLTLTVAAAFLAMAAAPVLFLKGKQIRDAFRMTMVTGTEVGGNNGVLMMVTAVGALLTFGGLLLAGRDRYRGIRGGKGESMLLLCTVSGCLWLMETYRDCAADPVLWDYVPLLLAVICGMLFYLDCAGLACGACHPRRTLWLAGMVVILSAIAVAGKPGLGSVLLLLSQTLAALAVLWRLPLNMEHPPAEEEPQDSEEEIQEEDTHV